MTPTRKMAYIAAASVVICGACSSALYPTENIRTLPSTSPGLHAFKELPTPFVHAWDETEFPFLGAAAIDIDGDGTFEVFVGGSKGQADALLAYRDGKVVDIIGPTQLSNTSATYGATSIDIDNNGKTDLLVARADGVHLYLNQGGTFEHRTIPVALAKDAIPFGIATSDLDRDGDIDLYISAFIQSPKFKSAVFNDPDHAKPNIMLLNNGDLTFTDITTSSGTAALQNTFLSVFSDLDGDGWQDLIVAQNTGQVEMFRNMRDATFKPIALDTGFGFWMGLAVGDIDNDGDQDLFFTNLGNSIPGFLVSGDIRDDQTANSEWLLLRNDGNLKFTDITSEAQLTGHGFAWGATFSDLNLDGHLDLLVAQNYIKWPVHKLKMLPGKSLLQLPDGPNAANNAFYQADALALTNTHFGHAPVVADINGDRKPDVIWVNMNGPARVHLNTSPHATVTLVLPDNAAYLGARVALETNKGRQMTQEVLTGQGFMTDQSSHITFGIPPGTTPARLLVTLHSGETKTINNPPVNTLISLPNQ